MRAMDWALAEDLGAADKLMLVTLAWVSDDQGVTFKGQQTLAERVGKDARWVRLHLASLADSGHVTRYRRHRENGSRTTDVIVLNGPRPEPLNITQYSGVIGGMEPGDTVPTGEDPPGGLPVVSEHFTGENPPGHPINLVEGPVNTPLSPSATNAGSIVAFDRRPAVMFDRRPVPRARLVLAESLLSEFNTIAATSHAAFTGRGRPTESLKRIIGALTDYPDLGQDEAKAMIRWRIADPFWSGKPDTGVVFGPNVIGQNRASARSPHSPTKRPATSRQIVESHRLHEQRKAAARREREAS